MSLNILLLFQADVQIIDEERETKTKETLKMLLDMKIKFPGKTDEEAKKLLEQVCLFCSQQHVTLALLN